ncbi:outer membrane protein assembly factor BamB [Oceanimonas sp. NS1]|uniref:Outer membrane protein assembly factor BamB n=1 Tax=Oceanimonas doudoroffii TaxID=84158 RepID=A0A233REI7_9GAMM|nr:MULTISPECIES: outer membrane protein assembly factor BamB [Oceanimonas]MCT7655840.1 outer membrane protein assembly factor BamB [Oceanimonas sp. NS1]NHI01307.1 Outer membrane protein assembly factor BamB [Oceanimonas sp. MB9]OXY81799.1 outer membrane protein assembly factor BamB [Oceanimonas doudoroffii]
MSRHLLKALPLSLSLVLGACSSSTPVAPANALPEIDNAFDAETRWSASVGKGVGDYYSQLRPAVDGDRLFAASRNGVLKAFSLVEGDDLWETELDELDINENQRSPRIAGGLTAAYGNLYFGSENGVVYAVSQADGELLWTRDVPGEVLAAPAVDEGKVVVHTSAGNLVALDAGSGEQQWLLRNEQPSLTLRSMATPITAGGAVLYGRADGRLGIALLANGQPVRDTRIASPKGATELERMVDVAARPVILGDILFTIAYNGQLTAHQLISGQSLWKRQYQGSQDLSTDGRQLYITDSRSHLFAVDARSGSEVWANTELENRRLTAPVVFGDYLVVGDDDGYLYWLNRDSGAIVSLERVDGSGLYVAPVVSGDTLYVQSRDGDLTAIGQP